MPIIALAATTYYVSPTGSDSNPGTLASPWKTLARAVSSVSSGDTVYLRAGRWAERLNISSKSYTSRTTFARYPSDPVGSAIIDGTGIEHFQYEDGVVHIYLSKNVRIDGLKVINAYKTGIAVLGASWNRVSNIEILNCITDTTGQAGIETWYADNCLIRGNTIYNANLPYGYEEILSIADYSTNIEVCYNTLYGSNRSFSGAGGEGLNVKYGSSYVYVHHNYVDQRRPDGQESDRYCMGIDCWTAETHHIYFYNNIVKNGSWGIQFNSEEGGYGHHFYAWNNIIIHCGHGGMHGGGIGFPQWGGKPGLNEYCYWWNNTIYDCYYGARFYKEEIGAPIEVRNNIFANCAQEVIRFDPGVPSEKITLDHNLTSGDPLFVNASGGNFRLQSGSPAINAGIAVPAVTEDFDGFVRPQGTGYDIGAYEYNGTNPSLSAGASANPASGQAPLTVNFSGSASGGTPPYSYSWTFGDGGTSTSQNPSYTYQSAGTYTATLTAKDGTSASASKSVTITVSAAITPLAANASASPTTGQTPLAVTFAGSGSGGVTPYAYAWTFGDGVSSTSTSQNPSHTYTTSGTYTATLTVKDSVSTTASKSVTITVAAAPTPLTANASASPTTGKAPLAINFTGSASGGTSPYTYTWAFGDGGTSTSQNPSHTYTTAGTYTATLTVKDSVSTTATKSVTITVTSAPSPLLATASANTTAGQSPLPVAFSGTASGGTAPYSYSWIFGDGASSTSQNPAHTYTTSGSYIAVLTVADNASTTAAASVAISVTSDTTATLSISEETGSPAPGDGGTTNPAPGTHSYSVGASVEIDAIPNTEYRFSKWGGDVPDANRFSAESTLTLNSSKSVLATFCTKCADVNGDLKITPADAQAAFDLYLKKISSPTWCELENADVNCSGTKLEPKITPADAQTIFNKYLKRGTGDFTCSGSDRAAATSLQFTSFPNGPFLIDSSFLTSAGDIFVPIIVESRAGMGAFGFDLSFPSDRWTYVGLEAADLTADCDQLAGNLISYETSVTSGARAAVPSSQFLRVGGYKTSVASNTSIGVLVILVFRAKTSFLEPSEISILAAHDDLKNALIYAGTTLRSRSTERQDGIRQPADRQKGRPVGRKSSF